MEGAYHVDGFRLLQGDALKIMRGLPSESFDMIFADPPYFLSNGGFTVHSGKRASVHKGEWDKSRGAAEDMIFHQAWVEQAHRLLKPAGTIWISGTYHSIYQCGVALQSTGFHILNDIAWFKPNASPNLSCRMFTASHETLIWADQDRILARLRALRSDLIDPTIGVHHGRVAIVEFRSVVDAVRCAIEVQNAMVE